MNFHALHVYYSTFDKNQSRDFAQKPTPGMTFIGGDLDVKVTHIQGHRMSCSALHLYHIKFGENRLNGMGTVAKKRT